MHFRTRTWALTGVLTLVATIALLVALPSSAAGGAQHVRWDIIHLNTATTPPTISAGGHASASAPNGGDTITLTGSGTFVAPANGGGSNAVTGGGTWTSSSGSGTYDVTSLVSWAPDGPQSSSVAFNDTIDDGTRTNGTAVLTVAFSDGTTGVLTIGCEGPGSPHGIFEGIATTKGTTTYYIVQMPTAGVDANRTNFHVR